MEINPLTKTPNATPLSAAASGQRTLGKEDFLKLLITQLRHQDPLSPMQNEEFVAQLAQFSSLEQMQNVNTNLEMAIQTDMLVSQALNNSLVTTLIGKEVKVQGDQLPLGELGRASAGFQLGSQSVQTTVQVLDANGRVVRSIDLGPQAAGDHRFDWDGRDDDGIRLPEGDYTFVVKAMDSDGQEQQVITYTRGVISGVRYDNGTAYLLIEGTAYPLGNVLEILQSAR